LPRLLAIDVTVVIVIATFRQAIWRHTWLQVALGIQPPRWDEPLLPGLLSIDVPEVVIIHLDAVTVLIVETCLVTTLWQPIRRSSRLQVALGIDPRWRDEPSFTWSLAIDVTVIIIIATFRQAMNWLAWLQIAHGIQPPRWNEACLTRLLPVDVPIGVIVGLILLL